MLRLRRYINFIPGTSAVFAKRAGSEVESICGATLLGTLIGQWHNGPSRQCAEISTVAAPAYKWDWLERKGKVRPEERARMQREQKRAERAKVNSELRRWRGASLYVETASQDGPTTSGGKKRGRTREPHEGKFYHHQQYADGSSSSSSGSSASGKSQSRYTRKGERSKQHRSGESDLEGEDLAELLHVFEQLFQGNPSQKPRGAKRDNRSQSQFFFYHDAKSARSGNQYHRSSYEWAYQSLGGNTSGNQRVTAEERKWRDLLGLPLSGTVTQTELKAAFRDRALKWHPDRHLGDEKAKAEANFKTAQAAYEGMLERCQH